MPSVSKSQQIAAAIALKAKKEGKKPEPGTASAQMAKMSKKDLEKFARTKHKGLPRYKKSKKRKVNESRIPDSEIFRRVVQELKALETVTPDFIAPDIAKILGNPRASKEIEEFLLNSDNETPREDAKEIINNWYLNEAWGQKLDLYIDIIWRWFERQGYAEHEIDAILNDSENIETIQSAEAHGINPIIVARDLKTTEISAVTESAGNGEYEKAAQYFYNEYLPENGFFVNKFTNNPEIHIEDPDAEEKIIIGFSKFMEEEHYGDWNPALDETAYKQIAQEFLSDYLKESLIEYYSPETLDEFLNEGHKN